MVKLMKSLNFSIWLNHKLVGSFWPNSRQDSTFTLTHIYPLWLPQLLLWKTKQNSILQWSL